MNDYTKYETEEIDFAFEHFDIDEKIEIATQTLERNIEFIKNCDNKSSFVLATISVIFTIIFSEEKTYSLIIDLLKHLYNQKSVGASLFLAFIILLFLIIITGIIFLISIFFAKTTGGSKESLIFFKGICNNRNYFQSFQSMKKHELLEDLIHQIYVNAVIANNKYKKYNIGFNLSVNGIFLFIILIIMVSFVGY